MHQCLSRNWPFGLKAVFNWLLDRSRFCLMMCSQLSLENTWDVYKKCLGGQHSDIVKTSLIFLMSSLSLISLRRELLVRPKWLLSRGFWKGILSKFIHCWTSLFKHLEHVLRFKEVLLWICLKFRAIKTLTI